jgi:subtilase family serine protease
VAIVVLAVTATVSATTPAQAARPFPGLRATQPNAVPACGPAAAGHARCFAEVRTDVHAGRGVRGLAAQALTGRAAALPPGYAPSDLSSAYRLPTSRGSIQRVAVVDAGDDPNAEADLAVYRATYGLPACTTANGCFRKINETGGTAPLPADLGWDVEISLDLDMVSAACPTCSVTLAEGSSTAVSDLGATVNAAVAMGARIVSNSYGAPEQNGMQAFTTDYSHRGVAIVASTGDSWYGIPNFPAVFASVVAVGGTTLTRASNPRGWTESAWHGATSGCSAWINKPSWQHDPNCPGRMVADVAADADPQTGPAVYDTDNGEPGWLITGGTSASAPFIAGVIALAGNPGSFPNAAYIYTHTSRLFDVVTGNNIGPIDCGGDYQCNAVKGYDGPTGNGTPNGISAF